MKNIYLSLTLLALMSTSPTFAQSEARDHGGGNGGDDLEMSLKKRSLQIASFVKSTTGSQVFNMINGDAVINTVNKMDIDVTSGNVSDKYGTLRTCVNEPERSLITCNLARLNELKNNKQDDILTGLLFHEILGLMGLELGHQDNVSMYPISSKIIPYHSIVAQTPISEADIRPEYYGLDSRSYGITLINRKTKESVRMICLNDNVEVHRCRNYSVVRSANDLQAPFLPEVVSFHPSKIDPKLEKARNSYAEKILNLTNDLSMIGKKVVVKDRDFKEALESMRSYLLQIQPAAYECRLIFNDKSLGIRELGVVETLSLAHQKCLQMVPSVLMHTLKNYEVIRK